MAAIRLDQMRAIFPDAPEERRIAFVETLHLDRAGINSVTRLEYFLAQLAHESNWLKRLEENLNYTTANRLRAVWPKRFPSEASTIPYIRNPEALANKVYGGRMGNVNPGDGYLFRGRGYIMCTGRENYRKVSFFASYDFEGNPQHAATSEGALLVSLGYWQLNRLNVYADAKDFDGLSVRINGGTVGLEDRKKCLAKIREVLR